MPILGLKIFLKRAKYTHRKLRIENFFAEIYDQGLAKNAQETTIYPAHFIKQNIIKEELLVTITSEIDTLEKGVHFPKQIEYTDHVSFFLDQIEDVHGDLCRLFTRPGKHFLTAIWLLHG